LRSKLVWIDLEMTGLDPEKHVILEIATILTDNNLEILEEGPDIVIHQEESVLEHMDDWSREQHGSSGLLERVSVSEYDCQRAERETMDFLESHCERGQCPLCGNSVWQDRRFLIRYMPDLADFLHYRNIDVSSLKELVKRWYPQLPTYEKRKDHRASGDIKESINELKYYRQKVFLPKV